MFANTYPLADFFWTMLEIFMFVIWIWLLFVVFGDIFRSSDMGGGAKGLWVVFVIVLPFLGVFIYLIARGGKMQERTVQDAEQQKRAFDARVRQVASAGSADELAKLATLRDQGVLTDSEFADQKAKLLN